MAERPCGVAKYLTKFQFKTVWTTKALRQVGSAFQVDELVSKTGEFWLKIFAQPALLFGNQAEFYVRVDLMLFDTIIDKTSWSSQYLYVCQASCGPPTSSEEACKGHKQKFI